MDYRTLTFAMSTYKENIISLKKAEAELEVIFYDLTNVKGVNAEQQGGSTNTLQKALNWHTQDEKYNAKLREVEYYQRALKIVEDAKKKIPTELWRMLEDKFVRGATYSAIGIKYGYSDSGMWHYLKRETEKYL